MNDKLLIIIMIISSIAVGWSLWSLHEATDKPEIMTETVIDTVKELEARYVSLKEKTQLTVHEYEELKEVIQALAKLVPGAITAFDSYGRAVDIDTDILHRLIELERQRARRAERK
jgi:molybdopterin converting factor small subunit